MKTEIPEHEYAIVHSGMFVGIVKLTSLTIIVGDDKIVKMEGVIASLFDD